MMKIKIKNYELLAFVGLWLWLGIYSVLELERHDWLFYFSSLFFVLPTQLPGMVFCLMKPSLSTGEQTLNYIGRWVICFFIILPLLTLLSIAIAPDPFGDMYFVTAALFNIALELLMIVNVFYENRIKNNKWVKKLGLENAVFVSVVLIALIVSVMAVSSLGIPEYDTTEQLLVGFEFSFRKVLLNFGVFLSFFIQFLLIYLSGYLLFFINSRWLVPKVLKQKGLVMYVLCLLSIVALLYPALGQLLILLPLNQTFGRDIFALNPFVIENAFGAISIMLVSLPIVLSLQWAKQNGKILQLEKEKSQTELDLLKQQLNPHFFFNTLNNLYGLSLQQSQKTPQSILRLAELMRYTIYKGQEAEVGLIQEINYLTDYIELQQIRLKRPLHFQFNKDIEDENLKIVPLLLIVFVENAFKHGIETAEDQAYLTLNLKSTKEKLYFYCENSVEGLATEGNSGIGLENLYKRLELIYQDKYSIFTKRDGYRFIAELKIKL